MPKLVSKYFRFCGSRFLVRVPQWAEWIAMDNSNTTFIYREKPKFNGKIWYVHFNEGCYSISNLGEFFFVPEIEFSKIPASKTRRKLYYTELMGI